MLKTMLEMVRRSLVVTVVATVLGLTLVGGVVSLGERFPAEETIGCAAVPGSQALIPMSEQLGMCVLTAAVSDLVEAIADPASLIPAIIGSCSQYGIATGAQIIQVIENYFASAPAVDSGLALSSVHAGRLKKVHDAAVLVAKAAAPKAK